MIYERYEPIINCFGFPKRVTENETQQKLRPKESGYTMTEKWLSHLFFKKNIDTKLWGGDS